MTDKTTADGGPAFPAERREQGPGTHTWHSVAYPGMSLRDYFAAKVLAAVADSEGLVSLNDLEEIAAGCYALADAMLAEREK
jgi:hypothetical protein